MDNSLVFIVLAVLTFTTALNLILLLRVSAAVQRELGLFQSPLTVPIGRTIPKFSGTKQVDGSRLSSDDISGSAAVIVFLSSKCPVCRDKIPELSQIRPAVESVGVNLWLAAAEPRGDISHLIGTSPLLNNILRLDDCSLKALNPKSASPSYIFIDAHQIVNASDHIGDENWASFIKQMQEVKLGPIV